MNIEFTYDEGFIDYIAEKAIALNSGARSLKTVFDDTISSAMFRIFAEEYSAINLTRPTDEKGAYILTKKRRLYWYELHSLSNKWGSVQRIILKLSFFVIIVICYTYY